MESSRRKSLVNSMKDAVKTRRDSIVSLRIDPVKGRFSDGSHRPSISGVGQSRRTSLRPPTNKYIEGHNVPQCIPSFLSEGNLSKESDQLSPVKTPPWSPSFHMTQCKCGRIVRVACDSRSRSRKSSIVSSGNGSPVVVTDSKFNEFKSRLPSTPIGADTVVSAVNEAVSYIQGETIDHDKILTYCQQLEDMSNSDSIDVVLARSSVIGCLLDVIVKFPDRNEVKLQACKALLKQAQTSEASLSYITEREGIPVLYDIIRKNPDDSQLQSIVLDIFGYISSVEDLREKIATCGHPSVFLTVMSRHESDVSIVKQCVIILGSLAFSGVTARSLMMVGGVHCIVSIMKKYNNSSDVLRNCCTTLGMFASHEETCLDVAEAGATMAVTSAMTSHIGDEKLQEAACWALACFTKLETICESLGKENALSTLLKTMAVFPTCRSIQLYGCWALSNMIVLEKSLEIQDARVALVILTECVRSFRDDVELQEQLCFSVSHFITNCENNHQSLFRHPSVEVCVCPTADVHTEMVSGGGLVQILATMKLYEDNEDVQYNGCRIVGNLAVNTRIRKRVEDLGSSDAIVRAMLNLDQHGAIQLTGCMALANLSADESDNKLRIINNGGIHALLAALRGFHDDEQVQLCALKTICNLLESDKACWSLVEDQGVTTITSALTRHSYCPDVASFACLALSLLPRKGIDNAVLQEVEEALLEQQRSGSQEGEFTLYLLSFYENLLTEGNGCKLLFTKASFIRVLGGMNAFKNRSDLQVIGCKIMAQLALDSQFEMFSVDAVLLLVNTMDGLVTDQSIQVLCCACISYLSDKEPLRQLLCDSGVVDVLLKTLRVNTDEALLQTVATMALETICRDGLPQSDGKRIADAVAKAMKRHQDVAELQLSGCNTLALLAQTDSHVDESQTAANVRDKLLELLPFICPDSSAI